MAMRTTTRQMLEGRIGCIIALMSHRLERAAAFPQAVIATDEEKVFLCLETYERRNIGGQSALPHECELLLTPGALARVERIWAMGGGLVSARRTWARGVGRKSNCA
jgi:hypothetical protein